MQTRTSSMEQRQHTAAVHEPRAWRGGCGPGVTVPARPALPARHQPATARRSGLRPTITGEQEDDPVVYAYYMPTIRQCRSTAAHLRKHLSPVTHSTHNTDWTAQHTAVHARQPRPPMHDGRCQCLPVPQSRVPGSAHGYMRPGQRPWPCTMRHKAKATTHMAQAPHARSGTLYPITLAACSCTRRLGGVTHNTPKRHTLS